MRARAAGHRLVAMPPDGARIRHHDQEARSNALVLLLKSAGGLRSVPYSRIHLLTLITRATVEWISVPPSQLCALSRLR